MQGNNMENIKENKTKENELKENIIKENKQKENMEIERKFLVSDVPFELDGYPVNHMEQLYVSTKPVIRIRKSNDRRILTVKSKGLLSRQEFEMDIDEEEYSNLRAKAEGNVIEKDRYIIPVTDTDATCGDKTIDETLKIELDVFKGLFQGLVYAEVEFPSEKIANAFRTPDWFAKDVTGAGVFQNSALSSMKVSDIDSFIKKSI